TTTPCPTSVVMVANPCGHAQNAPHTAAPAKTSSTSATIARPGRCSRPGVVGGGTTSSSVTGALTRRSLSSGPPTAPFEAALAVLGEVARRLRAEHVDHRGDGERHLGEAPHQGQLRARAGHGRQEV